MVKRVLATALVIAALPAVPAHASLLVDPYSTTAAETAGNNDGLVGPGDTISVDETVINSELSLTGVSGTLSTTTPGVTVGQATSPYPDMTFGQLGTNVQHFAATLPAGMECGTTVAFNLALQADQGSEPILFSLPTGTAGPPITHDSADVPKAIPDGSGFVTSSFDVTAPGRVKDLTVHIGHITHPYVGDLRLQLVAPDGTTVTLFDQRGGHASDLVNTVFSDSAAQSISAGSAPFTGSFRPENPLSALNGHSQQGTWRLKVSDLVAGDSGTLDSWGADIKSAVCSGTPLPSFTATPNPVTPGGTVQFDATESIDPNGSIADYQWDLDGDGTYETDTGSDPHASRTYAANAAVNVHLRVTDNTGDSAITTRTVSVTLPPTASLSVAPPSPQTADGVTLDASGSNDPDGSIARYEWDLDGNGTFERDTGSTSSVTTSYATAGIRTVHVRVTDNDGATDVTSADVNVQDRPPTASLSGPSPALTGTPTNFDAAGSSDPDGSIVRYEWDLDGNGTYETDTGPASHATTTYGSAATVPVSVRVTDDSGSTAVKTISVHVTHPPTAVFTAAPNPASLNQPVAYNASGSSDADGPLPRYQWDLDGNGSYETDTGPVPAVSHAYSAAGTYPVHLKVTDGDGATATATVSVSAANVLPTAALSATPNPVITGDPIVLDASGSADPDGSIVNYSWDLDGNGTYETSTGTVPTVTRSFPNHGTLSLRVRVTDNDGGTATRSVSLSVLDPPPGGGSGGDGGSGGGDNGGVDPGGGGSGGSGGSGGTGSSRLQASLGGPALQRLRTVIAHGLRVTWRADRAARLRLTVVMPASAARNLGLRAAGRRQVVLGSASVRMTAAGRRTVALKLTRRARRALGHARHATLLVRGRVTAAGAAVNLARAVLVRH